jgi:hypothetical protein
VDECEHDLRGQECDEERGSRRPTPGRSRELLRELGEEERPVHDLLVERVSEDLSEETTEGGEYPEPGQRVGHE